MKIDEAIKLQNELQGILIGVVFDRYVASIKLGIEALKARKKDRLFAFSDFDELLPGETK